MLCRIFPNWSDCYRFAFCSMGILCSIFLLACSLFTEYLRSSFYLIIGGSFCWWNVCVPVQILLNECVCVRGECPLLTHFELIFESIQWHFGKPHKKTSSVASTLFSQCHTAFYPFAYFRWFHMSIVLLAWMFYLPFIKWFIWIAPLQSWHKPFSVAMSHVTCINFFLCVLVSRALRLNIRWRYFTPQQKKNKIKKEKRKRDKLWQIKRTFVPNVSAWIPCVCDFCARIS